MTAITPVNINSQVHNPDFKGRKKTRLVSVSQGEGYETRVYETEASTGKKWGVGIASCYVPGLGQAINGQWGKAAGFFGAYVLTGILTGMGLTKSAKSSAEALKNLTKIPTKPKVPKGGLGMLALGAACTLGISIWSIVDAVKNARTKITQVIPKRVLPNESNKLNQVV